MQLFCSDRKPICRSRRAYFDQCGIDQFPEIRGLCLEILSRVFQFARVEFVRGFAGYPDPPKGPKRMFEIRIAGMILAACGVWLALIFYEDYRRKKEKRELRERQRKGL
ncbi:hypothetical protein TNIN_417841 [Trichonephila inaurata madagascariensis]|uniref:Uncharacterized protein n=1 Tax=Trichonephila inaurata madagascariensis TaxID=2747483 RepID=A0A8X7BY35_9ARAC|nr:hypothetical protein TNIN_417841 [Trichonephila inaurata madagascariensis]